MELIICEDLTDDQIEFGLVSVVLSGSIGFTDAVAYHFYEKGYGVHTHTAENVYDVKSRDCTRTIGEISLRLRLTCHGPEMEQVNRIAIKSNQSPLQPVSIDGNVFDFYLDKQIIQTPPKMMYENANQCTNKIHIYNTDIKDLLQCQRYTHQLSTYDNLTCNHIAIIK